jgi:hypothetical protein
MKDTVKVEFISTVDGLSSIEECLPKKSTNYIPEWWKALPLERSIRSLESASPGNARNCPSFADYFSEGYIIPMWTDIILYYNSDENVWKYRISDTRFQVLTHSGEQYANHVDHKFLGKDTYFIFKLMSPWRMISPEGYSMYQLPMFYDFNPDYSVIPGIRDSDIYHEVSIQLLIHSDKKEIFIPRGTPLAQYIPFKKTSVEIETRDSNDEDKRKFAADDLNFTTKLPGSKVYHKLRQNGDK